MNVIIVGAGDIGYASAETISEIHDVLVMEQDESRVEVAKSRLNVSVLHDDGTNPKSLEYAIKKHNADAIVSALKNDDSNLFVCMMAKRIDPKIRTIASVTNTDYVIKTTDEGEPGIDIIISPEIISAKKMYRLAIWENAVFYDSLDDPNVSTAIFAVDGDKPIIGKTVMHLEMPAGCTIFGIYRDGSLRLDVYTMVIRAGDRIAVFGTEDGLEQFNQLVGVEDMNKEFCILGASMVGTNIAKLLSNDKKKRYVKIFDRDPEVCREISKSLTGVIVINADFTDPEVQSQEGIFKSDCTIATSRVDDTNLLMTMTAQKHNARKVITRYFKPDYRDIFSYTGLESIIGYYGIISNEIIKSTVSDEMSLMRLRNDREVFFMHHVTQDSRLLGCYLGDLRLPEDVRIVAVRRGNETIYPVLDTKFDEDDRVVVFTNTELTNNVKKAFVKGKGSLDR
ncbi:MAG: NAD-binding protein [Candidatus Methanomethylophilaceae archaeon]|nr:NAD-binding protein [Candidatus Methanomethylophilaceae archaeon]